MSEVPLYPYSRTRQESAAGALWNLATTPQPLIVEILTQHSTLDTHYSTLSIQHSRLSTLNTLNTLDTLNTLSTLNTLNPQHSNLNATGVSGGGAVEPGGERAEQVRHRPGRRHPAAGTTLNPASLQGYLAHSRQQPPRTLLQDCA